MFCHVFFFFVRLFAAFFIHLGDNFFFLFDGSVERCVPFFLLHVEIGM